MCIKREIYFVRTALLIVVVLISVSGNALGSGDYADRVCEVEPVYGKIDRSVFEFGDIVVGRTKLSLLENRFGGFNEFYDIGYDVKQYCLKDDIDNPKIIVIFSGDFYDGFKTLASLEIKTEGLEGLDLRNCKVFSEFPEGNNFGVRIGMSEEDLFSIGSDFLIKEENRYCSKRYYSEGGIFYHNNMFITIQNRKVSGIFVQDFGEPE